MKEEKKNPSITTSIRFDFCVFFIQVRVLSGFSKTETLFSLFCFDDDNNNIDQIMEKHKTLYIRRHVIVILLLLILPFRIDPNPNRSQNH